QSEKACFTLCEPFGELESETCKMKFANQHKPGRSRDYEFQFEIFNLKFATPASKLPFWRNSSLLVLFAVATVAFAQEPPKESGTFRKPDLVELVKLDRTIKLDIRYATSNNFLGRPVYTEARAFLQRPAAEALVRANKSLRQKGYGLIIHDGYRPWSVTKIFWDATPADKKEFVADPSQGSRHNRGCAVDLSMFDLKTGKTVVMP